MLESELTVEEKGAYMDDMANLHRLDELAEVTRVSFFTLTPEQKRSFRVQAPIQAYLRARVKGHWGRAEGALVALGAAIDSYR